MGTTAHGLVYPDSTGHARIWEHMQTLAQGVDDKALSQRGYIADSNRTATVPSTGGITTVETVLQSLTFTAVAGVRYKVTAEQSVQGDAVPGSCVLRLRWAAGTSVTSGGTQIVAVTPGSYLANVGTVATIFDTFVPNINGSVTVGVTLIRNTGTANWISFGNANQINKILVEGV